MMKKLLVVLMLLFSLTYSYLPISINDTIYDANATLSANATGTSIESYLGVNLSCTYGYSGLHDVSSVNDSDIWNGTLIINETGSWLCQATSYNSTDLEVNTTSFTVSCPSWKTINVLGICYESLSPYVDRNTSYYDVGDNITIRVDLNSNSKADDVWLYSANNNTYKFTYSISKGNWYTYYKLIQKQEVLTVQSFVGGKADGVGDLVLTYNPNPPSPSIFEEMFRNIGYFVVLIAAGLVAIVAIIFALQFLTGYFQRNL